MALTTDEVALLLATADEVASCGACKHEHCRGTEIEHVAADTALQVAVLMCRRCGDFSVLWRNHLEGMWRIDRPSRVGLSRLMHAPIGRVIERAQRDVLLRQHEQSAAQAATKARPAV